MLHLQEQHGLSQRRACALIGCHRKTARRVSQRPDDPLVRERMKQLADEQRAWGYRLLCGALRFEGFSLNHKRAYRLYKEERLEHRPRGRKRIQGEKRGHLPEPTAVNEVWVLDFMSDALQNKALNGRKSRRTFRTLNVMDAYTRQCHAIEVDTSLAGYRVQRVLQTLVERHGKPRRLQIDNGPEFRCHMLYEWAKKEGVELYFIDPGKPNQNNRIESFNSRFRAECLNQELFLTLAEARRTIEAWRIQYNTTRPHSSLKYLPPNEWTRRHLERLQGLQSGLEATHEPILGVPTLTSREGMDGPKPSLPPGSNRWA